MPLHRKHLPCDPASPHPACLQLLQGESLWGPTPCAPCSGLCAEALLGGSGRSKRTLPGTERLLR